ncbi:heavy metal translocating P-type ATPase [Natronococcus jeotgali]|nr:cation-translocating P-type ATPase [Natronococcus jeotgali]
MENNSCHLCGRTLPWDPVENEEGFLFCCPGCRKIQTTLVGDENSKENSINLDVPNNKRGEINGRAEEPSEEVTHLFLRIDGMHSATCESFLESVAEESKGVVDAEASYVTETIRIEYNPDQISKADLRDTLSTLGYTAYFRDDISEPDQNSVGSSRRSREMNGIRKRRTDEILNMRYAAGILFGGFLMVPYIALLYPTHLASFLDWEAVQIFANSFQLDGAGGLFFLRLYFGLTGIILFFTGLPVLRGAYVSIKMRRPNTDLLVAVTAVSAYIYSTAAVLLGRNDIFYDLTVVVAAVVTAAVFYESSVKQRALNRLTDLTVSQVDTARVYNEDGTTTEVAIEEVNPGDRVLVRQGERVPVDGVLIDGNCTVNESVVTGESLPVGKKEGDDLVGGSIVTDSVAIVEVDNNTTSSIDRITTSVWNLQSAEHGIQRQADYLASQIILPLVGVAIVIGVILLALRDGFAAGLLAFLTVLIVGSPWVLGLATPLSVATSLEEALEQGVVVFDETVFERLRETDFIVFDKTGTLTTGEMKVIQTEAPQDLLAATVELERLASHPAANAIVNAFADEVDKQRSPLSNDYITDNRNKNQGSTVSEYQTHAKGVQGVVDGSEILVGNLDLFKEQNWKVSDSIETRVIDARGFGRLPVIVGRDGVAEGIIIVGDEPREGWDETVTQLSERGAKIIVLTGDDQKATDFFRRHPHVEHVFAGVPPEGKTATIHQLKSNGQVTMVGDGTNDAPALAAADLGVSLASGTALAADAADITIVDSNIGAVETAFDIANSAYHRVKQNNRLALSYNALLIPIALVGLLNPLTAAIAVLISCGLIAANCSRNLI